MKYVLIVYCLMNVALAETGPKGSGNTENRVKICCGKSTSVVVAPNPKGNPVKTDAPKGKAQ
ncbi:MAG: hypothetical protein H0V66_08985 [Bdellovibrionales bacterium]|nr:hypothetical protein [Bdellovibrionales bacterium]